ncbi:MAG: hypothetical protein IT223_03105 [Crocinitomicaceae bacterium]|nr:hypothetical protein [Crocinitomicaceae bacterium]
MKYYIPVFICLCIFCACDNDPIKKVDVSGKIIPFTARRFDLDLFNADFSNPIALRQQLYHDYGSFYCDFVELILQVGPCENDSTTAILRDFVTYPDIALLEQEIKKIYTDEVISDMNHTFENGLKRWNHFFPDSIVPGVIYMNSGFNYSAYSTDSVLAVGLDYFLGAENPIVGKLASELFPQYIKEDMKQEYAVCNAIKNFVWHKCERADATGKDPNLLTMLMHHGKMMYITHALLPDVQDSIIMNWSSVQAKWAEKNEKNTWKELANEKIMFGTKFSTNKKWFDYGPFTNAENIPQSSPPQLGIWMGLNFIRAYMKAHPEVTFQQLLMENDYQKILKDYKPYI